MKSNKKYLHGRQNKFSYLLHLHTLTQAHNSYFLMHWFVRSGKSNALFDIN